MTEGLFDVDKEEASKLGHRVIVQSLPGAIELQFEFDDTSKVSAQDSKDEFKLGIKKPEGFLPHDVDFETIDLAVLSNMKFYRYIPPMLSKEEAKKIEVSSKSMNTIVRSTQAINIYTIVFDGGMSVFFYSSIRSL